MIEAGEKSGALITAKFSADQGRDVFAVPGSVLSPMSRGPNNLLAAGAIPLTSPAVILENLNLPKQMRLPKADEPDLDAEEARVLSALGADTLHIDDLCQKWIQALKTDRPAHTHGVERSGRGALKGMEYAAIQSWKID